MTASGLLVDGRDFYLDPDTGYMVFTAFYLSKRGYCCGNGCRHCPYGKDEKKDIGET